MKKKVLITGAAGEIGGLLIERLQDEYDLVLVDIQPKEGIHQLDLSNPEHDKQFYGGVDCIIHLAADHNIHASWQSVLTNNIITTQHVFAAAQSFSVKKIIFASSIFVMEEYFQNPNFKGRITETMPKRPMKYYGVSKSFGEDLGYSYHSCYDIDFIALRLGAVRKHAKQAIRKFWLSFDDCAQIFRLCLETKIDYGIFHATSNNAENIFNISKAKKKLGYQPRDCAPRKKSTWKQRIARCLGPARPYAREMVRQWNKTRGVELVADFACVCGENPLWHPTEKRLYWLDIPTGRIFWHDPKNGNHQQCYEGSIVGGFTIQQDGALLLFGANGRIGIYNGNQVTSIIEQVPQIQNTRFNDVIADPEGNVWCGTMPHQGQPMSSQLYLLSTEGNLTSKLKDIGLANGLGFTPDNQGLYYTDSNKHTIYYCDYDPNTATFRNCREFVQIPKSLGMPDGLTVDSEGYVWTAIWGGYCVIRYAPDGTENHRIFLPVPKVTSLTFGGENYQDIYITTAGGKNKTNDGFQAGALFRVRSDVQGKPEFYSKICLK